MKRVVGQPMDKGSKYLFVGYVSIEELELYLSAADKVLGVKVHDGCLEVVPGAPDFLAVGINNELYSQSIDRLLTGLHIWLDEWGAWQQKASAKACPNR